MSKTAETEPLTFSSTLTTKYSYDIVCKSNVVESPFLQLVTKPGTVHGWSVSYGVVSTRVIAIVWLGHTRRLLT
jgi:hypothetical protein